MRVLLHIGTEKTGTTAVQEFLSGNQDYLSAQGIVPACALDARFNPNSSFLAIASDPSPGESLLRHRHGTFEQFRQQTASRILAALEKADRMQAGTIVFSSEHLSSRLVTPKSLRRLRSLFGTGTEIRIVCYLRRQDELLLGAQAEGIKYGNPDLEMEPPRMEDPTEKYGRPFYDFQYMLGLWEECFGLSSMQVAAFEKSQLKEGDVVTDFCERMLRLELTPARRQKIARHLNRRLSAEALFALASLNALPGSSPKANRDLIAKLDDYVDSVLIRPEVLAEFYARFEQSNEAVARRYLDRTRLFTVTKPEYRYFDISDARRQREVLARFLAKCAGDQVPTNERRGP